MNAVRVIDIWEEVRKIVGNEDERFLFRRISDAVELCSNKGEFDPLLCTLDIVTSSRIVALPPEVETILGCNFCGRPAIARDEFFQFHVNGPGQNWGTWGGSESPYGPELRYEWMDLNDCATYREIERPTPLLAICEKSEDVGSEFWVFGFDQHNNVLRSQDSAGKWRDGLRVPVFQNVTALPADSVCVGRITRVQKPITAGPIRLFTVSQLLLGVYQGNETEPVYRRIMLSRCVPWIRIRFRRRTFKVTSKYDIVPVNNPQALLMMLRALKAYDSAGGLAEGEAFESTAVRWMTEEQQTSNPPVAAPIQVLNCAPLLDDFDYME